MSDFFFCVSTTEGAVVGPDGPFASNGRFTVFLDGYFRRVGQHVPYSHSAALLLDVFKDAPGCDGPLFEGSFCAAIYDRHENVLTLLTDIYGSRPLYYCRRGQEVFLSTRLLRLVEVMEHLVVSADALADSKALGFVRAPTTMVEGICRVPRNSVVDIRLIDGSTYTDIRPSRLASNPPGSEKSSFLITEIERALEQEFQALGKVHRRVAILLSGGIDSSILASYAAQHFDQAVAFSCEIEGFDNPELERARYVAAQLKIPHKIIQLRKSDVLPLFEKVVDLMEGPSRHINNIVTLHLFDAIQGYDAIIGGDGADALFGSSNQRTITNQSSKLKLISRFPGLARAGLRYMASALSLEKNEQILNLLTHDIDWFIDNLFTIRYGKREQWVADKLGIPGFTSRGDRFQHSESVIAKSIEANFELFLNSMLLRNSLLSKGCNAPMYYPFLTEGMLQVFKRVPDNLRFDNAGEAKPLLRELCRQRLGSTVVEWPKLGFVTPEKSWLSNELRAKVERLYSGRGGMMQVLSLSLGVPEQDALTGSTRLLWWLIGLDECLQHYQDALSKAESYKTAGETGER